MPNRYFLREGDTDPREVSLEEFKDAELKASLVSKFPGGLATDGFSHSGPDGEIEGAIAHSEEEIEQVLASLQAGKQ
jgi:hypothetical protein